MLSVVSAGAAAGVGGMDRLRGGRVARDLAAARDRQVRLHAVHTDIAINLPPSLSMPDGEDHPFSSRLHVRDPEQVNEFKMAAICSFSKVLFFIISHQYPKSYATSYATCCTVGCLYL